MRRSRPIAIAAALLTAATWQASACSSGSGADELLAPVETTGSNGGDSGIGGCGQDCSTAGQAGNEDSPAGVDAGPALEDRLPSDLHVREVALFQAVKVPLARNGWLVDSRNAPVLAGRTTVFRVHLEPSNGFEPRPITAELRISHGGADPVSFSASMKVQGPSSDAAVGSAFDIQVPADQLTSETQWSVRLLDPTAPVAKDGADHPARFPLDGSQADLGAQSDGPGLHLVPLQYDTDGSGRLPDTSDAQIEVFRALLTAVYPLVHTQITVHEPLVWNEPLWFTNVNFNEVNDRLFDLKQQDGAPEQAYYYGLINPAESLDDYCAYKCVTGQSFVVEEAGEGDYRIGAGMGFSGEDSAWTMIHEMGHMHGRLHAPCAVSQWDEDYPYSKGGTGTWGWDSRKGTFSDPAISFDLMGYCEPMWISDYTFAGLFERVLAVGSLRSHHLGPTAAHRFLHVSRDGTAHWGRDVLAARRVAGNAVVKLIGAGGTLIGEHRSMAVRQSHGGYSVLIPSDPGEVESVEVSGAVPKAVKLAW